MFALILVTTGLEAMTLKGYILS